MQARRAVSDDAVMLGPKVSIRIAPTEE